MMTEKVTWVCDSCGYQTECCQGKDDNCSPCKDCFDWQPANKERNESKCRHGLHGYDKDCFKEVK